MINYLRLKKYLDRDNLYDPIDKEKLKELAELDEMNDIIKKIKDLFGYKCRYVLLSIYKYLKEEDYNREVLLKIIKDKLYLVSKMQKEVDADNGPDLERLCACYDSDTYQLLIERFAKHYCNAESTEYSALKYCNVLFGYNKEKIKYITVCLIPSNISKLLELKPSKLETYLGFLSIRNPYSTDFIEKFVAMIDTFEKLDDHNFEDVLRFIYQDQDSRQIYERLNLIPLLLYPDKQSEDKIHFNSAIASKLLELPKKVQKKIYQSLDRKGILRRFESMFTEPLVDNIHNTIFMESLIDSIHNTASVHQDTIAELFVNPDFYKKTSEQKYYIVESLRKNGENLEENVGRYQQKLDFILSIKREKLLTPPFLKATLDFVCQQDSYELLAAKEEAIERFNGDFQDKSQYGYYLALLQMNTSDKTDEEKIQIITSRSQYLTEKSFTDFYQEVERSSNKKKLEDLLEDTTNNELFLSVCSLIRKESNCHPDVYAKILGYVNYLDSESNLDSALQMIGKKEFQQQSPEEQERLVDSSFENIRQTFCLEGCALEITGMGLLKQSIEQGELRFVSSDCKAQIKVKKI